MKEDPAISKSRFTEFLVRENSLDRHGFDAWAFRPGMLFLATEKWWGDQGKRTLPHEGVDFCLYEDRQGRVLRLEEGIRVPVMYDGVVVRIIDDFLGKSVIAAHGSPEADGPLLLTIYGHTVPLPELAVGKAVKAGEIIASIARAGRSGGTVYPHLHVSVGRTSGLDSCRTLTWANMAKMVVMSNPLDLMAEDRYHMIGREGL